MSRCECHVFRALSFTLHAVFFLREGTGDGHVCGDVSMPHTQIYADVNNGVYKSGFSTTQPAYDEAQVGV